LVISDREAPRETRFRFTLQSLYIGVLRHCVT
jgi:hypothetical protein